MSDDDDIIVAGEDPVDADRSEKTTERCGECGAELEWTLTLDCMQKRVCPNCDE